MVERSFSRLRFKKISNFATNHLEEKKNVIPPTILNNLWTYVCRFSKKKLCLTVKVAFPKS